MHLNQFFLAMEVLVKQWTQITLKALAPPAMSKLTITLGGRIKLQTSHLCNQTGRYTHTARPFRMELLQASR